MDGVGVFWGRYNGVHAGIWYEYNLKNFCL